MAQTSRPAHVQIYFMQTIMEMHSCSSIQEASVESRDVSASPWPLLPHRRDCAFGWLQLHLIVVVRAGGSDKIVHTGKIFIIII